MSPTARSLKELRDRGYTAQVVERFCVFSKRRIDLFGCIDIVAVKDGETVGVQATTTDNQAARLTKLSTLDGAVAWIRAGNKLVVHGWGKKKVKRGGKAMRWELTETEAIVPQLTT